MYGLTVSLDVAFEWSATEPSLNTRVLDAQTPTIGVTKGSQQRQVYHKATMTVSSIYSSFQTQTEGREVSIALDGGGRGPHQRHESQRVQRAITARTVRAGLSLAASHQNRRWRC